MKDIIISLVPKEKRRIHKGDKIAFFTIIEHPYFINGRQFVLAKCICGIEKWKSVYELRGNSKTRTYTRSCGCKRYELENISKGTDKTQAVNGYKICSQCDEKKTLSNFYKSARCRDGREPACKLCKRNKALLKQFGISQFQYEKILEKQNFSCAICGKNKQNESYLDVDHSHITGKIRGLLCRNCNSGIGLLLDSKDILFKATEYLQSFESQDWSI